MKIINRLFAAILITAVFACNSKVESFINEVRPSATPLITVDPYFSVWSFSDNLNTSFTRHWTGIPQPLDAYLRVDGHVYRVMGREYPDLMQVVPAAKYEPWDATYMICDQDKSPIGKWYEEGYDDSSWQKGKGAFGSYGSYMTGTVWKGLNDIYIRRCFDLDESQIKDGLSLEYVYDEDVEFYINDSLAIVTKGYAEAYEVLKLNEKQLSLLKPGHNFIACHCLNRYGTCNVDFGFAIPSQKNERKSLAVQKSLNVLPTSTIYSFECGPVDLQLTFTSPLLLDNLEMVSRPVNYISYEINSNDGNQHDVQFLFTADPRISVDLAPEPVISETGTGSGFKYAKTGTIRQPYLGKKGDNIRIDWGYFYLAACNGEILIARTEDANDEFLETGKVTSDTNNVRTDNFEKTPVSLVYNRDFPNVGDKVQKDFIMVAYDDVYSIQYFWKNLKPYWNREGTETILGQLATAAHQYKGVMKKCTKFDAKMLDDAQKAGGKKYAELCALAYRQSIAAHKLVESEEGELLFLSKECFSNGCIGTVDVSYPSVPLFLLYNPDLVKGMMNPIFEFSESGRWNKPFATHDVGTYPMANGEVYGGDGMPVEESGNMLIMTYAIARAEGNAEYAQKHWETLSTWANYLMEFGMDPAEQLCTDDFGGHLAHNANLSIKAILGIASYGKLLSMLGDCETGDKIFGEAKKMAAQWETMANDGDHYRLSFDRPGTWSQKYNLVWDKVFGFNIFDSRIADTEVAFYLTKQNEYGVPLDSRKNWTKTDWIMWSATLADNIEDFKALTDKIWKYQNETYARIPMSDFIYTDRPMYADFRARSVVGGYFMKMLEHKFSVTE